MSEQSLVAALLAVGLLLSPQLASAQTTGPDLLAVDIWDTVNYYGQVNDVHAYSVGSRVCNVGDAEVDWVGSTNRHPVVATELYRLMDGRFEQIGMSWARHGFLALANDFCVLGCTPPDPYGYTLGVGCSNPGNANLNGSQARLGPRGHVNALTGEFPYHFSLVDYPPKRVEEVIDRRLQVAGDDLDPALNPGALYFVETQYVSPHDCEAGTDANNIAYRPVTVNSPAAGEYELSLTGTTVPGTAAIHAWKANDPTVEEAVINVPSAGFFIVAAKVTDLGGDQWRYEYALFNYNCDRSAQSFAVWIPHSATPSNIGFHDIDHHSGDGYPDVVGTFSTADWSHNLQSRMLKWECPTYDSASPPTGKGNALRWGTLYNFRFDCDREPALGPVRVDLYMPARAGSSGTGITWIPKPTWIPAASESSLAILACLFVVAGMFVFGRMRKAIPRD
ncbi:MAG: hypothetical protein ABII12_01635 [Planctomycetota bacterium]